MRIKGIHINSSMPFFIKNKGSEYYVEDFEILTTILSALMWRMKNGPIKLYTDAVALDYYKRLGITNIWDGGIDTEVLTAIPSTINQEIFWAAAKLFALKNEEGPVAMIDTDLIIWEKIEKLVEGKRLLVLHREDFIECYPPFETLKKREGYIPDERWNWTIKPCNTAFAYFNDDDLKTYYTDCALDFMEGNDERPLEMISQMVFAEQRILGMCADVKQVEIYSLLDDPFQDDNKIVTHLWGTKDLAKGDSTKNQVLCSILVKKLLKEFPNFRPLTPDFKALFDKYR